ETAKEEIQSSNEELDTVNDELDNRNIELDKTNNDLVNLLGSIDTPIVILKDDLEIRRFNSTAQKELNLLPTDIGRKFTDIRLKIDVPDIEQMILNVIDTLKTKEMEVQDSAGCWHSVRIKPYLTQDKKIEGVVIAVVDVNKIKQSAEEIKEARDYAESIIATLHEPLLVLSEDLKVITANIAFCQTFKVSLKATVGQFIYNLGNGEWDIPELRTLLEEILPGKTTFHDYEVKHTFSKLGEKTMALNARQLHREKDKPSLILLAIEDITKRKKAENVLKRDKDTLEILVKKSSKNLLDAQQELDKAKRLSEMGKLAATVAHELRNPLSVIRMAIFMVNHKNKDRSLDGHINNIEKKISESERIITNLLTYAGTKMPDFKPVKVYDLINESLDSVRAQFSGSRIKVMLATEALKDLIVEADSFQLKEVFNNILDNAYQSFEEKPGKIEVSAECGQKSDSIRVIIKDAGCGIAPDELETVFEPFFTNKPKGTGLGLTICRDIVKMHNGNIEIASIKGKGTTVAIVLPKKRTR
ncbi:MAG: ATP-binding protein, partial [Candidatus Margulisiibacteriota bacterium]